MEKNELNELYYDHYKDSFQQLEGYLAKRDKLTMILFVTITIVLFFLSNPTMASLYVNNYLSNFIKEADVDFNYLNTCALYYLLWVVLRYYHINILIESRYKYIHKIEKLLDTNGVAINREGGHYKENKTLFAKFVQFIYVWGVPFFITLLSIFKIHYEIVGSFPLKFWDFPALTLIILLSVLYGRARVL